jgi:RecJ-like exonuclease
MTDTKEKKDVAEQIVCKAYDKMVTEGVIPDILTGIDKNQHAEVEHYAKKMLASYEKAIEMLVNEINNTGDVETLQRNWEDVISQAQKHATPPPKKESD